MDRRQLLRSSLLLGAMLAGGRRVLAESRTGYGPLVPVEDDTTGLPLLKLPDGFRYRSLGWEGEPMLDGSPTPDRHDGMALMTWPNADPDSFVLMRNHERTFASLFARRDGIPVYDTFASSAPPIPGMGGGTTALVFVRGRYSHTVPTLTGTILNCAGGPTPWGSWLTCEELVLDGRSSGGTRRHGYVFEVPAPELGKASARPIIDMGRMKHEAAAVDPVTGFVYLTEDNGPSGFYRFTPNNGAARLGALEDGGRLEMLKVRGVHNADLGAPRTGDELLVEWVRIRDPDAPSERTVAQSEDAPIRMGGGRSGPYLQGEADGGAAFRRLEGCFTRDGLVYFVDTKGGDAGTGAVWALAPSESGEGPDLLRCVFASSGEHEADNIDNVCVSPRGGIVLCEDGGGIASEDGRVSGTRVIALAANGAAFPLVENNMRIDEPIAGREWIEPGDYRPSEFAGVCFSPRGDRLFVNVQTPGVTFEIRGPWREAGV